MAAAELLSTWEPAQKHALMLVAHHPDSATGIDYVLLRASSRDAIEDEIRFQKLIADLSGARLPPNLAQCSLSRVVAITNPFGAARYGCREAHRGCR